MGKSKRRDRRKEYDAMILSRMVVRWERSVFMKKRKWTELSSDILVMIYQRIDAITMLTKVIRLCRNWLALARNEPQVWKKVDMTCHGGKFGPNYIQDMACVAVNWSAGQLEEFSIEEFGTYELLHYIAESTSNLKSISLINCGRQVSEEELEKIIKRWPLLEEIHLTRYLCSPELCQTIGQSCPRLKFFRSNEIYIQCPEYDYDYSIAECVGQTMHGLRSLQLIGSRMTNEGLLAILEGCPQLESLDIRNCDRLTIDESIERALERITNLRLPDESTDDYKFPQHVFWLYCTCCNWLDRSYDSSDNDDDSDRDSQDCFDFIYEDFLFRERSLRGKGD